MLDVIVIGAGPAGVVHLRSRYRSPSGRGDLGGGRHPARRAVDQLTFTPMKFDAEQSGTVSFCGCKQSGNKPRCDGSHNKLP